MRHNFLDIIRMIAYDLPMDPAIKIKTPIFSARNPTFAGIHLAENFILKSSRETPHAG